jgi:hypothetical protein
MVELKTQAEEFQKLYEWTHFGENKRVEPGLFDGKGIDK